MLVFKSTQPSNDKVKAFIKYTKIPFNKLAQ